MSQHEEDKEATTRLLEVCNDSLTKWEYDFLESIHEQMDEGRFLTSKQRGILNKIWEEKGK